MTTEQGFDLSPEAIPESWHDAAQQAPEGTGQALHRPKAMAIMPSGRSVDLFTASLVGSVVCLVGGYLWYELESSSGQAYPWLAVALGMSIALAVRIGGGDPDHGLRAIVSLLFYVIALSVVVFLTARINYQNLYGSTPGFADFEQELLRSRLTNPWAVTAWVLGGVVTVQVSHLLRSRR